MQDPWLWTRFCAWVEWKSRTHTGLIIAGELPDNELVVPTMGYDAVVTPSSNSQDGVIMSLPYRARPHDGQVPGDDETIGITSDEALIVADEGGGMYLRLVTSEDRLGCWRSALDRHFNKVRKGCNALMLQVGETPGFGGSRFEVGDDAKRTDCESADGNSPNIPLVDAAGPTGVINC